VNIMKCTCPKCSKIDNYRGKSGRKKCSKCGHKYKVTPNTNPIIIKQQKQQKKARFYLSETEVLILTHLKMNEKSGLYQQQLADKTGFNKSTIYRRLHKLKDDGLVKLDTIGYPRIWRLNPIPYSSTHKHQFVCEILHGYPKIQAKKTIKMKNWEQKTFEIWLPRERIWVQNAILNTKTIVFWMEAEEKTTELAIQKANDNAFLTKLHLEKQYNIKLGYPKYMKEQGNQEVHALPKYGTGIIDREIAPKDPTLSTKTWTDNTPEKDTIESGLGIGEHKTWFDNVNHTLPNITHDIGDIKVNIGELVSQFSDFRTIITKLMNNMGTLADNQSKVNEKLEVGFKAMSEAIGEGINNLLRKTNETQEQPKPKDGDEVEENASDYYL